MIEMRGVPCSTALRTHTWARRSYAAAGHYFNSTLCTCEFTTHCRRRWKRFSNGLQFTARHLVKGYELWVYLFRTGSTRGIWAERYQPLCSALYISCRFLARKTVPQQRQPLDELCYRRLADCRHNNLGNMLLRLPTRNRERIGFVEHQFPAAPPGTSSKSSEQELTVGVSESAGSLNPVTHSRGYFAPVAALTTPGACRSVCRPATRPATSPRDSLRGPNGSFADASLFRLRRRGTHKARQFQAFNGPCST